MMDLAVLIIAYTRPNGVSQLMKVLTSLEVRDIYVSLDGPRNEIDKTNNIEITEMVIRYSKLTKTRIHINQHPRNLGVAAGVLSAVDWFFSKEEMGVILEDDLVLGKDFLKFTLEGLISYRNDQRVWMISGTQVFSDFVGSATVVWTNYPMIWGWGGWREKWFLMRSSLLTRKKIRLRNLLNRVDLYWIVGSNRALSGKVDTWDTQLAYEFLIQKKLCLLPPVNLVTNVGSDKFASNSKIENETMNMQTHQLPDPFDINSQPDEFEVIKYNSMLEQRVFRIKLRHLLVPYYSMLFDFIKFPKSNRKNPLVERMGDSRY